MPNYSSESSGLNFPKLDLAQQTSPNPVPAIAPVSPEAYAQIGAAADRFGAQLNDLATRAAQVDAKNRALDDVTAGRAQPANEMTVWGQTYNEVAKQTLGVQRQASMRASMGQAYVDHADDPGALDQALKDIRTGMGATGFKDLDAQLAGDWAVQHGDFMVRAAAGLRERAVAQGRANFADTLEHGVSQLAQTAAGASFDDTGWARVSGAYASLLQGLGRFGPKEAYDVGGVHFDADPTRLGALQADDIQRVAGAANAQAKVSWILGQNDRLASAAAKTTFLGDLRARYAAGDGIFDGVGGERADQLFDHLEAEANKTAVHERQDLELHAENARRQIEALQWGGAYDRDTMMAEAQASGDPGLIARASFMADVDKATPGVFRSVVARSMGLTGEGGIPGELLDAQGRPIAPAAAAGSRAARNNNPGNLKGLPNGQMWPGQTGTDPGGFAVFASQAAGVAAADRNLVAAQTQHGRQTIAQIVGAWAPASDGNDPTAYAATVAKAVGVDPNQPVDLVHNGQLRSRVLTAMFGVEGGGTQSPAAGASAWAAPPAGAQPGSPAYVAWANAREGFNADPLKYAQGHGLAAVPAIVPQNAFSDDAGAAATFGAAMKQRLALGASLQAHYGVPLRLFTTGEADDLKSYLQQSPAAGVVMARHLTAAIGPAATVQALRELGQNGPEALTEIHLGNLAALGKAAVVQAAVDGMRLKAEGADNPKWDPAQATAWGPNLPKNFDEVQRAWGAAFAAQPDTLQAVRNVADLARLADTRRGVAHPPWYYMQAAAGATNAGGAVYGGVAIVNGAPALLPHWLRQDAAPEVLLSLGRGNAAGAGDGPVYANGQRVKAEDFAQLQLVARPDGRYGLVNPKTGRLAKRADGSAYILDLDAARASLKLSVPGAVLP